MKNSPIFLLLITLVLSACSPKPVAINYGSDGCSFCRMTIVDKIHAAEIVTNTGKAYKFDAIECMVNYLKDMDGQQVALYLSNHYNAPGELIDATKATFLISESIPSPMGAFLTAFKNRSEAQLVQSEKEGKLYNWDELLTHISQQHVSGTR